jgi:hypothetical protein
MLSGLVNEVDGALRLETDAVADTPRQRLSWRLQMPTLRATRRERLEAGR